MEGTPGSPLPPPGSQSWLSGPELPPAPALQLGVWRTWKPLLYCQGEKIQIRNKLGHFPGGAACQGRGHKSGPWSKKIPRAAEQLSLWTAASEPSCHSC